MEIQAIENKVILAYNLLVKMLFGIVFIFYFLLKKKQIENKV